MKPRSGAKNKRGTTLVEVLIAMALMLLIFIFLTADLIQSSDAENLAADHSASTAVGDYLLGLMRSDGMFWNENGWTTAPSYNGQSTDACGNPWPAYHDDITNPSWHPGCGATFPELAGQGVNFQYMWNAQLQNGDQYAATMTVWVMTDEGGRRDVYELKSTRMNNAPAPSNSGVTPPTPTPTPTPSPTSPPPSKPPTPTPSPKPSPSPTATPTKTPKPSPSPSGIFE